jgi:acetyl esterase/lipase
MNAALGVLERWVGGRRVSGAECASERRAGGPAGSRARRIRSRSAALLAGVCVLLPLGAQAQQPDPLRDVSYAAPGTADPRRSLDLYRPAAQPGQSAPVLLYLFGGGLMQGSKEDSAQLGEFFAARGWLTAVANYRLSPDVSHPAHVQDAAAAFDWLADHAAEHGGDPARIAVMGHSAGGYLAALLALDGRYLEARGRSPREIAAVIPLSGFFHVDRVAPDRPLTVWGSELREWRQASPAAYVSEKAPPMLLLYADGDAADRRQESRDLASALRARGARRVELQQIAERDHSSIASQLPREGDPAGQRVLEYLAAVVPGVPAAAGAR